MFLVHRAGRASPRPNSKTFSPHPHPANKPSSFAGAPRSPPPRPSSNLICSLSLSICVFWTFPVSGILYNPHVISAIALLFLNIIWFPHNSVFCLFFFFSGSSPSPIWEADRILLVWGSLQGCWSQVLSPHQQLAGISPTTCLLLLTHATDIWVWSVLKSYPSHLRAEVRTPCLVCADFRNSGDLPRRVTPSLFGKPLSYLSSILLIKETR